MLKPKQFRDYLHWSPHYNVGIQIMDEQHLRLIDIANELYHGVLASRYTHVTDEEAAQYFRQGMRDAVDYVTHHFATEENLMRTLDWPEYASHKSEHERYARAVLECTQRFEHGNKLAGMEFVRYLRDWLLHHVSITDKDFAAFAKHKGLT
jgi:hemerythrin